MVSSFYPATMYHERDQKRLLWELEKENDQVKRLLKIKERVIYAHQKETEKLHTLLMDAEARIKELEIFGDVR